MCTLAKVCDNGASQAAIGLGGTALFAKFSRSDEAEADAEGVSTSVGAGISPLGIPAMFRILLSERRANPNAVDAFFASHPLAEDRITETEALIARYPASQIQRLTKDTPEFRTFRRWLLALPPSPATRRLDPVNTSRVLPRGSPPLTAGGAPQSMGVLETRDTERAAPSVTSAAAPSGWADARIWSSSQDARQMIAGHLVDLRLALLRVQSGIRGAVRGGRR